MREISSQLKCGLKTGEDMDSKMKCRICGNGSENVSYKAREMMFGLEDEFEYIQCAQCDCLQLLHIPKDMSRYYPERYYSLHGRSMMASGSIGISGVKRMRNHYAIFGAGALGRLAYKIFPGTLRETVWRHFPGKELKDIATENSAILDVGCGAGNFLYDLKESGFKRLLGVDPNIHADIIYDNGLKIVKGQIADIGGVFDIIMFHHSFEHILDPIEALRIVSKLLSKGGICLMRVPTVTSYAWGHYRQDWVQLDAPRHIYLHSVKSIEFLSREAGFEVTDIVYDSSEFQFWGSEQYASGIPLKSDRSYGANPKNSIFSDKDIIAFKDRADVLNSQRAGDQAAFYLKKVN